MSKTDVRRAAVARRRAGAQTREAARHCRSHVVATALGAWRPSCRVTALAPTPPRRWHALSRHRERARTSASVRRGRRRRCAAAAAAAAAAAVVVVIAAVVAVERASLPPLSSP